MTALKNACMAAADAADGDRSQARVQVMLSNGTIITGQPVSWNDERAELLDCQYNGGTGSMNGSVTGKVFVASAHVAAAWPLN